jgi:tRNA modification GTPase
MNQRPTGKKWGGTPPLPGSEDTIAALGTSPGQSALAVIRLSGPKAFSVARRVVTSWPPVARQAILSEIADPRTGMQLDRAIVVRYESPRSYTGEDLVEITPGHRR